MSLKDRKFIPYYIAAAVIIFMALLAVLIISLSNLKVPEPEITTEPEISTLFMNGEVPFYEDIPASAYSKDFFTLLDNGRMAYTDASVNYTTGIDVSSYQGNIDWEKVKADGIDFAIIRVGFRGYGSSGIINEDEMCKKNIREASDVGMKIGVYFFSQATTPDEAEEEADFVLEIIKDYNIVYPVVFDWENDSSIGEMRTDSVTGDVLTQCAVSFCEKVKSRGYTPGVYFNLNDAYLRFDLSKVKDYPFWYAQFKGTTPAFYYNYNIWQYSCTGSVDGINCDVDLNISFTDYDSLG